MSMNTFGSTGNRHTWNQANAYFHGMLTSPGFGYVVVHDHIKVSFWTVALLWQSLSLCRNPLIRHLLLSPSEARRLVPERMIVLETVNLRRSGAAASLELFSPTSRNGKVECWCLRLSSFTVRILLGYAKTPLPEHAWSHPSRVSTNHASFTPLWTLDSSFRDFLYLLYVLLILCFLSCRGFPLKVMQVNMDSKATQPNTGLSMHLDLFCPLVWLCTWPSYCSTAYSQLSRQNYRFRQIEAWQAIIPTSSNHCPLLDSAEI